MSNPLLESYTLPPFDRLLPEHVVPGIDAILAENRAAIAKLGSAPATWEAVPAVLEQLQDRLDHAWAPVSHLNAVMNSEAWREAYNGTLPKLAAYSTELGQNEALFTVYEALEKSRGFADFNQAQQQSIRYALRDFRLSGIGLPADKKKRFADIQEKFAELSSGFADSVLDATQAWGLCLDDASR